MTPSNHQYQLVSVIAELLNQFDMDFETFSKQLRSQYVKKVYNECQNFSLTALTCGVDRRIVSAIIKDQQLYNKRPLLHTMIQTIGQAADLNKGKLAKCGINSLHGIIDDHVAGATTVKSVIDVLVASGVIIDQGQHYDFIGYPPPSNAELNQQKKALIIQLFQLINEFKATTDIIQTDQQQNTAIHFKHA